MDDKSVTQEPVAFLEDVARYFENRPTGGEDSAHWANVYNAENCRKIANVLRSARPDNRAELEAALREMVALCGTMRQAIPQPSKALKVGQKALAALSSPTTDHSRGLEEAAVERVMYADEWSLHGLGFDSHTGGFSNVIARPRGSKDRADEIVFTKAEILAALGQAK